MNIVKRTICIIGIIVSVILSVKLQKYSAIFVVISFVIGYILSSESFSNYAENRIKYCNECIKIMNDKKEVIAYGMYNSSEIKFEEAVKHLSYGDYDYRINIILPGMLENLNLRSKSYEGDENE